MRRGPKPKKSKEAKPPVARQSPKDDGVVRDLEKRLEEALKTKAEAEEQQRAAAEILQVISRSPTDVSPVFDAILANATRLCAAQLAVLWLYEGTDLFRAVAFHGASPEYRSWLSGGAHRVPPPLFRAKGPWRPAHVEDATAIPQLDSHPLIRASVELEGMRTILGVPLVKGDSLLGGVTIYRRKVARFSDELVALVQTFAAQAVIAIENVRLFNETKEALERQTATGDILRVIANSPTDAQPVFEAIVQSAMRLCDGTMSVVSRYDGELIHLAAYNHVSAEAVELMRQLFPMHPTRSNTFGRVVLERGVVHIPDVWADAEFNQSISQAFHSRSILGVPMLLDGRVVGAIAVARQEVRPFTDKQIALLQTFADQAVIAIENVRLFKELQEKNTALTQAHAQVTEALEQQTATSEILRVISNSPTDVGPAFTAMAASAARLCEAFDATIFRVDGDVLRLVAHQGQIAPDPVLPLTEGTVGGRVVAQRRAIHVTDMQAETREYPMSREFARNRGFRTILSVPLLHDGQAIGVIAIRRSEVRPFTDRQVELVKTFADQAVIAIENVRLFRELESSNRDLRVALEQQTATAEILRVISGSPTDVQPVFDTIAQRAMRLCAARECSVFRFDGDLIHLAAMADVSASWASALRSAFPRPPGRGSMTARAILTRSIVHIPDCLTDREYELAEAARAAGNRSVLAVPMIREAEVVGAITVSREEPSAFTDKQIELVKTFADQAVIAIENVRLFTELQASNRELTTALDKQTATSDILRVISGSRTDVQPVFDAIVQSAVRLLRADVSVLTRVVGDQLELAALTNTGGDAAVRAVFPLPLHSEWPHTRCVRDRVPLNIVDTETDPRVPESLRAVARARGFRGLVTVPLVQREEALGAIAVARRDPGGFTDDEIALLETFADQAVIAIENARLLSELQARTQELSRSVGELQALGEVGRAISATLDLQTVLRTIVARATQLADADAGVIYEYDEQREVFEPRATERLEDDIVQTLVATPVRKGEGATGRLADVHEPSQLADLRALGEQIPVRDILIRAGYRALLAVPLVREDHLIGGLTVFRKTPGEFPPEVVELLKTFATQSALAIQNARLFREIEEKSRQLEVASHHKSEFLANMSHELRTPLNAIIGFSEVLTDRMFGELNEKQDEYLKDIYASGTHLLSLINDILDLSKIEAGRMELELTDFHLPTALDNALTLVRERAGRRSIALHLSVDERLGQIQGDERKVRQVVLNLLSNAIKFTPEGGRIEVQAVPTDGLVQVSVADTGVGIAPEDQEAVFEEFRQVGTADKKVEGTGLGLTLCQKFVELHGGKIWVKSQVGEGSTFTFTIPMRRGE